MTKSDTSSETASTRDPERSRVLFTLQATRPEASSGCLDEVALAALVEHKLPDEEAERAYAHLAACPDCYERWIALGAVSESAEEPKLLWFRRRSVRRWTAGLAMAASLLLAIIVWRLIPQDPLEMPFERLADRTISMELQFPLPWDGDTGYALGGDTTITADLRKLALGIWTARREYHSAYRDRALPDALADADIAQIDESAEYRLGQWLLGLFLLCETGGVEEAAFWSEQQQAAEKLKIRLGPQSQELLASVAPALERLVNAPGNPRYCRKLSRLIERIIAQRL